MAPFSSLTNVLDTSGVSTVHPHGKTLPDISLGSVESSFRSEDEEARAQQQRDGELGSARPGALSSNSSNSLSVTTPSPPHSALQRLAAPRPSRIMRHASSDPEDDHTPAPDSDDGEDLLSMNMGSLRGSMAKFGGRRNGRHSVAAGEIAPGATTLTLKEQEKLLDITKKQNFSLQMENHFLKERLSNLAPEHMHAALAENAALKAQLTELARELKKHKKLVQEQHLAMQMQQGTRGDIEARRLAEEEVERLKRELENKADASQIEEDLRNQLEDAEASEALYKNRSEALEDELETAKVTLDDRNEELERVRDAADRAQEELEKLRAELGGSEGLRDSVGVGKGREARLTQRLEELEQDNESLLAEIEAHKKGIATRDLELDDLRREVQQLKARLSEIEDSHEMSKHAAGQTREAQAEADILEENINILRDKLAAAQIDIDNRDRDIEDLNEEMDARLREHEKEIEQVEADWRDEVVDARGQVEELKDILLEREQELKDLRDIIEEREDELAGAREQIGGLQAMQQETADRLEDTLQNIERDNVDKDSDLIAANREIEALGQRVFDLEELVEDLRSKELELGAELDAADQAFEEMRGNHGQLVDALKDKLARHKDEVSDLRKAYDQAREELDRHRREVDELARQIADHEARHRKDAETHRRLIADREQANSRLQAELEAARDRVSTRDRDLDSVQNALRSLENERRKIGDEHTSDRFSLELEIDRVKRDLVRCEDDLETAREDLLRREEHGRQQELEMADLLAKQQELENLLSTERQTRLNMSEKLDQAQKTAKRAEREAEGLRERVEELEPLLTETQSERLQLQKQSEQQHRERTELLLRVFKDVNSFLGAEDHATPANFSVFRDTLVQRLRIMSKVRTDFEKRVKETEASVEQRMNALKKQLEQKWRSLDTFEASVKKLEVTRMSWRSKYSIKEGELDGAKSRIAELNSQISALKVGGNVDSSSQIRSLTERAVAAEKRHNHAVNQLAAYEAKMADLQSRNGHAENKWEARVREYENRLRIAGEKIKTEKQGGKERAAQLEAQVRDLEQQVEQARKRNQRAEGVVARTAHIASSGFGS